MLYNRTMRLLVKSYVIPNTYDFLRTKAYTDKISISKAIEQALHHYYDLDYVFSQEEKYKRFKKP